MSLSRFALGRAAAWLTLPLADLIALVCAAAITGFGGWRAAVYATLACTALAASGLHRLRICLRVFDQAGRIAAAVAVSVACVLPLTVTAASQAGRLALLAIVLVLACRTVAMAGLRNAHRCGWLVGTALLVGVDETARQLARLLQGHPDLGLRPAGFLASGADVLGPPLPDPGPDASGLPVLGQLADLGVVVVRHRISRVIVSSGAVREEDLALVLRACRSFGAAAFVVPRPELGAAMPRGCLDEVLGIPVLSLCGRRRRAARLVLKRAFDLVAAAALLMMASPLIIALAAGSRLQLRRPALFRQVRVVGSGRLAEIVKLRTLHEHGDCDTYWAPSERQCTRFGWILRASHLDELPQLVNVLRGEMSLVGPRPERPYFARQFAQSIPGYGDRQRMPAGMTGWAQVHGLNGDTSIRDRVRFDNSYIECWSFWLDLVILARTVPATVAGAFHPAAANAPDHIPDPPAILPSPDRPVPASAQVGRL